ncbi:sulfatase [Vibrio cortegadensis]|uniref:sulfatase n=1 Tax=Vibrio cortegadensis TaxID=1328770 RepID=UPI0021C49F6A|nr:sulfatase [Vibrio cortegadensis]MDN3696678.1 sulfatase [Vibrio cortegadensis]
MNQNISGKTLQLTTLLAASMAAGTSVASTSVEPTVETQSKPNVLLIMVDDLKPNLGVYGDNYAISPNIDAFAKQGMRFDMAYANQAVCMPSRINFMLGSRSTSTGVYNFATRFRALLPDAVTLPEHFKNNGYKTESIGKVFHIGHGNIDDKQSWSEKGYHDKVIEYVTDENRAQGLTSEEALFTNWGGRLDDPTKYSGIPGETWLQDFSVVREFGETLPTGSAWEAAEGDDEIYADGRVAKVASKRLEELSDDGKPFMLAVGFARPHLPLTAPKKYWDMFDREALPEAEFVEAPKGAPRFAIKRGGEIMSFTEPKNAEKRGLVNDKEVAKKLVHGYYASVAYMDAQVGKVLAKLEETGLDENTIVLLWGDHGFHLGDHGSWTKHSNYEQATRIPVIIKAPGVTKQNTSTSQIMETVDIYPTIVKLAGLYMPEDAEQQFDGQEMTQILAGKDDPSLDDYAYHVWPQLGGKYVGYAIRDEQYRMVRWHINKRKGVKYKYELYDFKNDPLETENIAKKNLKIVERLEKILDAQSEPVPVK